MQVISSYSSRKIGAASRSPIDVARELAVDYLLNGNLRRKSDQVRIAVQLHDSSDGRIVWAERYDAIDKAFLAVARKKPLTSLAAYDCWLRGMDQMRRGTPEADLEARRILKKALEIDPNYSRAYAGLSLSHFNDWSCQLWEQYEETAQSAYEYALEASRLDEPATGTSTSPVCSTIWPRCTWTSRWLSTLAMPTAWPKSPWAKPCWEKPPKASSYSSKL